MPRDVPLQETERPSWTEEFDVVLVREKRWHWTYAVMKRTGGRRTVKGSTLTRWGARREARKHYHGFDAMIGRVEREEIRVVALCTGDPRRDPEPEPLELLR